MRRRLFLLREYDSPGLPASRAESTFSRRSLLGRGAVAAVAAGALPGVALAAPKRLDAFRLDPDWGADERSDQLESCKSRSCHACRACHEHADRWLFASRDAIERAHVGCRCVVVPVGLSHGTWTALFGPDARHRSKVRRDSSRVQAILRNA